MTTFSIPEVREFPDSEELLTGWLRGFDAAWRVVTVLPNPLTGVVVRVTRIGGRTDTFLDYPRIDIDVYAPTREAASSVAREIQSKLPTIRGVSAGGGVFTDVQSEVGSSWRPDLNPNVKRFGLVVQLTLRIT